MKKLGLLLAALLMSLSVFSQTTPNDDERLRIRAERTQGEVHYQMQEAQCYSRFAVTDCLNEVRARRRTVRHELRRKEIVLNNIEREQKAREQLERIRQKSALEP